MAFTMTNRGLFYLLNNAISSSTDIRAAVFKGTAPSVATIRDYDFLSSLTGAMTEAAATNYARVDLAGVTITESDASDNVVIGATAWTMNSVGAGETWTAIGYYIEGASDAARTLIGVDLPSSSITTNGSNITGPALVITITGS
jgi:hypothetical protein